MTIGRLNNAASNVARATGNQGAVTGRQHIVRLPPEQPATRTAKPSSWLKAISLSCNAGTGRQYHLQFGHSLLEQRRSLHERLGNDIAPLHGDSPEAMPALAHLQTAPNCTRAAARSGSIGITCARGWPTYVAAISCRASNSGSKETGTAHDLPQREFCVHAQGAKPKSRGTQNAPS